MNSRNLPKLALVSCLAASLMAPVLADRGMVPLADVSVFGPGQKAILAWNGQEEVLILSTDVYADRRTTILEVLPLPSQPDLIERTNLSPFTAIQNLLSERKVLGQTRGKGVDIIFHEKIGAHDITVVKVDDSTQFQDWANLFLKERGMEGKVDSAKLAYYVDTYIEDGVPFFVLDLIDVSPEPRSIEPIIYRFRSESLYFPLRISALAEGESDIAIFAINSGPIEEEDIPHPLTLARFTGPLDRPVRFRLREEDLEEIDTRIWELFEDDVWLTAIRYSGPLKDLSSDLVVTIVRTPLAEILVSSPFFWLAGGVAMGIILGLLLGHVSMGALRIEFKRLVSIIDFIGIILLMVLASVMAYAWASYVFWLLVPLGVITLFFSIRTGGRSILIIYLALPFLTIAFVLTIIVGRVLETSIILVIFAGFAAAATFPPAGRRELSSALRRSSRWVVASTRKRRL